VSAGATRDGEARFLAALATALERAAGRAEPVSVVVAVAPSEEHAGRLLDASQGELPPEALAIPLGGGRLALLLPATGVADADLRGSRIAAACRGTAWGVAGTGEGGLVGPDALLAEAEAAALGVVGPLRRRGPGGEEVGSA
jgi:hypothetical protein